MADIIDTLMAMDDAALAKKLGFADKVKSFQEDLKEASALSGKFREEVVEKLEKIFVPSDYAVSDFGYAVDSAQRRAAKADTGEKQAPCDDMLAQCGCVDSYED